MKKYVKSIIGNVRCMIHHIKHGDSPYIGIRCKLINLGEIIFENNVTIRPDSHIYVDSSSKLIIGSDSEIGRGSTIAASSYIKIGRGVLTGPHVFISDHNHEYRNPQEHIYKQGIHMNQGDSVEIGEGTWLGTNVVIAGNVKIGKQCVVGANSVVTKDIPDYCVAVGSPAKVIKRYNLDKKCWE